MEIREIHGKHGEAVIYTVGGEHAIDAYAIAQIERICDDAASEGSTIRVMPDVHPGKVGPIGLTMTVGTRLLPNLTGVDAGCGMTTVRCKAKKVELAHLDAVVREAVPAGGAIRKNAHRRSDEANLSALVCARQLRADIVARSLGTLGGGNHFIEAGLGDDGDMFLTVHSGSRHLGVEFTEYYLKQGQAAITAAGLQVPYEVTWIEGGTLDDYLHDIAIVQDYASLNRDIILDEIMRAMKWKPLDCYESRHNYIDMDGRILRKGAISAKDGETVIIPVNMRDGILLGRGRGNPDWNRSAPHGAGRIVRRTDASSMFTVSQYKKEMKGIYSSCIGKETLDEAPFCYRNMDEIRDAVADTVEVTNRIRPIYNFKAGRED